MATLITTLMIIGLYIVIFAALIAIVIWASKLSSKMRPYHLDNQEGTITPGKASAWLTVIVGVLMVCGGIAGIILDANPDKYFLSVPIIILGGAIAGFMAPSLTHMHDLIWTSQYVEGASTTFGGTLGKQRTRIYWADITQSGSTFSGYWHIQSANRQKIYWSYLYRGHREFAKVLIEKCPHIKLP